MNGRRRSGAIRPNLDLDILVATVSVALVLIASRYVAHSTLPGRYDAGWAADQQLLLGIYAGVCLLHGLVRARSTRVVLSVVGLAIIVLVTAPDRTSFVVDALLLAGVAMAWANDFRAPAAYVAIGALPPVYGVVRLAVARFFRIGPMEVPGIEILALAVLPTTVAALVLMVKSQRVALKSDRGTISFLRDTVNRLTQDSAKLLQYAANVEEESTAAERRRITRDLHDVMGHTLTDVIVMMDAHVRTPPDDADETRQLLGWVRDHNQRALTEVRRILYDLRESHKSSHLSIRSLVKLADSFEFASGIDVRIELGNSHLQYGLDLDGTVYRIVQESLVNSLRHGRATAVTVLLWDFGDLLQVVVQDNGTATSGVTRKGIGQSGMEERVAAFGGTIEFGHRPYGYEVRARIPLNGVDRLKPGDSHES